MKKRISIMVALVMLITNMLSVVSFADFNDVPADSSYRESIITLSKLGVINGYDDGTFKPEGQITRAEFTKMIVTALGRGDQTTEPTEFSDVSGHWARYNIKAAYDMGIINGFDDGTFKPDDKVTYEQALKMVVCTLGYVDFAEQAGGYPTGYTSQAETLKLTKGVTGQVYKEPATRQVISQVVYNALEVEKREMNLKGIYELTGKTVLNNDLGVYKLQGVLVGVEDKQTNECTSTLLNYQMAVKNSKNNEEIIIDVSEYTEKSVSSLQNYVGSEVIVYYSKPSSSENSLVIFDADTVEISTQTIKSYDIDSYNGSSIKYYEEGYSKAKSVTVDASTVTVMYNGAAVTDSDDFDLEDYLNPGNDNFIYGDITLTDNGSDGTVDMITINDYEWMVAHKSVSSSDYTVQNTLDSTDKLVLDPNDVYTKVYVEKNGKEVAPTQIAANDIVTYTVSLDGTIKKAYAGKETVTGIVNSISGNKVTISGKEYKIDSNLASNINLKTGKTLKLGDSVTMYLDKMGIIVYGTIAETTAGTYGYITDVNEETAEDALYVTVFLPSKSTTTAKSYKLASKVKVNGTSYDSYVEVKQLLKDVALANNADATSDNYNGGEPENITYSQVARIKLSGSEITEIVTLNSEGSGTNSDAGSIVRYRDLNKYTYTSSGFKLNGTTQFTVNSSTMIITVPADRFEKEAYTKKSNSYFNSGSNYYVEAYDVGDNKVASLVIVYGLGDATVTYKSKDSSHHVVGDASQTAYDEEEDTTVLQIPVYSSSTTLKSWNVLPAQQADFEALQIGDVFQFDYDNSSRIQNLSYVLKYSDIKEVLDSNVYDWSDLDFKYKNSSGNVETYTSSSLGTIPYSRAVMYNVLQVLPDEGKLLVTKENPEGDLDTLDYEEVKVSTSTNILKVRYDSSGNPESLSNMDDADENKLSIDSFKDAKTYGAECSKIMVSMIAGNVKLVVIYE